MSQQIDTALVQTYRSNLEIKFQQMGSRLRDTVRLETQHAEFDYYDRIGPVSATQITTRAADTPLFETPFDRRRIAMVDYDWADIIDRKDKLRMLADPTSAYATNAVYAMGRAIDSVIISAALGTAYTGKTGSTTVSFSSNSQIPVNYVESGTAANSNLTIGKLRHARYLLEAAEAIQDNEQIWAIVSASQIQSLLRTTEVTNADYASVKALVNGTVDTFMGFKFVRTQLLTQSTGANLRDCLFYPQSGITCAMGQELTVRIDELPSKRYSAQVYVSGTFGASRMWEEKVLQCICDETK